MCNDLSLATVCCNCAHYILNCKLIAILAFNHADTFLHGANASDGVSVISSVRAAVVHSAEGWLGWVDFIGSDVEQLLCWHRHVTTTVVTTEPKRHTWRWPDAQYYVPKPSEIDVLLLDGMSLTYCIINSESTRIRKAVQRVLIKAVAYHKFW